MYPRRRPINYISNLILRKYPKHENKEIHMPLPKLNLNFGIENILGIKSVDIETPEQVSSETLLNTATACEYENSNKNRWKRWSDVETVKFYICLQTFGRDFGIMSQFFPNRTRDQLKSKFKREKRNIDALINKAILFPNDYNIEKLKQRLKAYEISANEEKFKLLEKSTTKETHNKKVNKERNNIKLKNLLDLIAKDNDELEKVKSKNNLTSAESYLEQMTEHTLCLVNTKNEENGNKIKNEVYMMDTTTGILDDKPLVLPPKLIKCIAKFATIE